MSSWSHDGQNFSIHHSSFIVLFVVFVFLAAALRALTIPVIALASSNMNKAGIGWARRVEYTARATAGRDVEYSLLQDWGHLDVLLGTAAAQQVFAPLADWIDRHTPASSP